MKQIVWTTTFALMTVAGTAQSPKFQAAMEKGIAEVYQAKTPEAYQNSINYFERIGNAEKDQWLPHYYAAYALVMKAWAGTPPEQHDALMMKADEFLAKADALAPGNSDISVLKSMTMVVRMGNDQSKSMILGPQATQMAQKAIEQDAANPRAYLQMAQMLYYTPEPFGGGKTPGMKYLDKAIETFASSKPASSLHPAWGEAYAKDLKTQWSK